MRTRNVTLDLDNVPPGSLLAEAVSDAHGMPLLPAGASVTESHLQGLRRRGIEYLCVAVPVMEDATERATALAHIEKRIDHLFRHVADSPVARDIKQRVLDFRRSPP